MDGEKEYRAWVQERRDCVVSGDFADRVMARVLAASPPVRPARGTRILAWVASRPFAQAAAIALATGLTLLQSLVLLRIGIG